MSGKGSLPNSTYSPKGKANFDEFFMGSDKYYVYQGKTTFGDCKDAIWVVSTDLAAASVDELRDISVKEEAPYFETKNASYAKVQVFKNFDPKKKPDAKKPDAKKPDEKKPDVPNVVNPFDPKVKANMPMLPTFDMKSKPERAPGKGPTEKDIV